MRKGKLLGNGSVEKGREEPGSLKVSPFWIRSKRLKRGRDGKEEGTRKNAPSLLRDILCCYSC